MFQWGSSQKHTEYDNHRHGGMPAPEQTAVMEEGLLQAIPDGPAGRSATNILASVKEQELQFEQLTRELEVERQIVASQLERCRLGSESPDATSGSSSEKSYNWRCADASILGESKSGVMESPRSPTYHVRSEQDQVTLYSPGHAPLHERSSGNSTSTQINSFVDSGYQEAGRFYSSQNFVKTELRLQHSYPGITGASSLLRSSRAEGQSSVQAASGRAMRRVSSVPSRTQSPGYSSGVSPSRGSLRTPLNSAYGSPVITEPKPLSSIFSTSTLPSSQRPGSPYSTQCPSSPTALRRVGSAGSRSGSASLTTSPYQATGSAVPMGEELQAPPPSSPVRSGMTAVPQHCGSTLPYALHLEVDPYDVYERMILPHPNSLADALVEDIKGLPHSYASQHSQLGQDARLAMSPDHHIYKDGSFQGLLYHSPNHGATDLNHGTQGTLYRAVSGVGNLQRTSSQRGVMTYQRSNYALNAAATYTEPYTAQFEPAEAQYVLQAVAVDEEATRSPSIDSIQKDPREFAWRDPDLPEVIHMLQHQFPSVQANAAAYLQHLCYGDNGIKAEVCRLGGIKHLVDLLEMFSSQSC
ncbi:hypothetical protein AAFF_G00328540 [Aldrovandia affinis]|uniref:Uncharacterized protein n=1 Tax=Aldrovandia affinis TaxID=143900 RepID=A0AAD7TBB0_9TELE|nr:hypothetical protein AAFF_G00328540 [Aldrovandia affinis]